MAPSVLGGVCSLHSAGFLRAKTLVKISILAHCNSLLNISSLRAEALLSPVKIVVSIMIIVLFAWSRHTLCTEKFRLFPGAGVGLEH